VDAVEEVLQIEEEQIEDAPSFTDTTVSTEYIFGMAKIREDVKMLLDIDKVVSAESVAHMSGPRSRGETVEAAESAE
jgi:purine-binding chemotaxis protein CheW